MNRKMYLILSMLLLFPVGISCARVPAATPGPTSEDIEITVGKVSDIAPFELINTVTNQFPASEDGLTDRMATTYEFDGQMGAKLYYSKFSPAGYVTSSLSFKLEDNIFTVSYISGDAPVEVFEENREYPDAHFRISVSRADDYSMLVGYELDRAKQVLGSYIDPKVNEEEAAEFLEFAMETFSEGLKQATRAAR